MRRAAPFLACKTIVGGIDLNKARIRYVVEALITSLPRACSGWIGAPERGTAVQLDYDAR
jgi:hypothetical protein